MTDHETNENFNVLPAPVALTPEQVQQVAAAAAAALPPPDNGLNGPIRWGERAF